MRDAARTYSGVWRRILHAAVLLVPFAFLLGGCSPNFSAPVSAGYPLEQKEKTLSQDGWNKIVEAVNKSKGIKSFGLSGTLETREQNKFHRSTVYGHVILPDQIDMSQEVDGPGGRKYYIYQDQTSAWYREEGVWRPSERVTFPDTFGSLERLTKIQPPTVYRLEDESFLTHNDTEVYQFEADAVEIAGLPVSQGKKIPSLYTIYIDRDTRYVKQIEIVSTSAADDVGTVISNAVIRFFDYNKAKIEMPDGLKQQLKSQDHNR